MDNFPLDKFSPPSQPIEYTNNCLARNLLRTFEKQEFTDVVFVVGKEKKKIGSHKVILASQSEVFRTMLYGNFKESCQAEVTLPDVSPAAFELLMRCLYGQATIPVSEILSVMQLASFYAVNHLRSTFIAHLGASLNTETACILVVSAEQLSEGDLFKRCFQYIVDNAEEVIKSTYFLEHITPQILEKLLQHNDIALEEVELFTSLLEWLTYDSSREIYRDIFMKHIRFPTMSPLQLIDVVEPTKMVSLETVYSAISWQLTRKGFTDDDISVTHRVKWNWKKCGTRATIQGNTVISNNHGYALAIGDRLPPRWSVKIESTHPLTEWWALAIGVTKDNIDLNNYITCGPYAWAYYSVGAFLHHSGNTTQVQYKTYGPNDVVTVQRRGGEVTFLKNGEFVGVMAVPENLELYPVVHLNKAGTKITIVK